MIESKNSKFPMGSVVLGDIGWEQYSVISEKDIFETRIIPGACESPIPLSSYLGVLGMPGEF